MTGQDSGQDFHFYCLAPTKHTFCQIFGFTRNKNSVSHETLFHVPHSETIFDKNPKILPREKPLTIYAILCCISRKNHPKNTPPVTYKNVLISDTGNL